MYNVVVYYKRYESKTDMYLLINYILLRVENSYRTCLPNKIFIVIANSSILIIVIILSEF